MPILVDGPANAFATILLAHGAGAPMDSSAMNAMTKDLAGVGFRISRFEFAYMEARRSGARKPPPKADLLQEEYKNATANLGNTGPLIIGGKSMGGRVASMVADKLYTDDRIAGLLCLGYPFHPPAKLQQLRTAHLVNLRTPTLICQGTRDPFGPQDEAEAYDLSDTIKILCLEDGDHDLKPRKKVSGFTAAHHLQTVAQTTHDWAHRILAA